MKKKKQELQYYEKQGDVMYFKKLTNVRIMVSRQNQIIIKADECELANELTFS